MKQQNVTVDMAVLNTWVCIVSIIVIQQLLFITLSQESQKKIQNVHVDLGARCKLATSPRHHTSHNYYNADMIVKGCVQ